MFYLLFGLIGRISLIWPIGLISPMLCRALSCLDPQLCENALQVVVAGVFDDDFAVLGRVVHGHARAQVRGEFFLDAGNGGGIGGGRFVLRGGFASWRRLVRLHEFFGVAHALAFGKDAAREEGALRCVLDAEEHFGVSSAEEIFGDVALEFGVELEEAQGIGDGGAWFAHALGGGFGGELEIAQEAGVAVGFLDWIQTFALEILDEPEDGGGCVARGADARGDGFDAEKLEGAPAAFARDELVFVAVLADDDGLKKALGGNAVGEFLQLGGREIAAGLRGAGDDAGDGDFNEAGQSLLDGERGHDGMGGRLRIADCGLRIDRRRRRAGGGGRGIFLRGGCGGCVGNESAESAA